MDKSSNNDSLGLSLVASVSPLYPEGAQALPRCVARKRFKGSFAHTKARKRGNRLARWVKHTPRGDQSARSSFGLGVSRQPVTSIWNGQ